MKALLPQSHFALGGLPITHTTPRLVSKDNSKASRPRNGGSVVVIDRGPLLGYVLRVDLSMCANRSDFPWLLSVFGQNR